LRYVPNELVIKCKFLVLIQ